MADILAVMSGPLARSSDTPSRITTGGGGSAANVAAWLAHQRVPTTYVGKVGDDALGRQSVAALDDAGVSTLIAVDPALPTGTCIVLVEPGGERSMLPDTGANGALRPDELPASLFRPAAHLHLSGYTLLHPGSRDAGLAALRLAADARMTTSVDPSSAALLESLGPARFLSMTEGVGVLFANRDEALALAPQAVTVGQAAESLSETYGEVVVTLGAGGALWRQGFIGASAPAERSVEVVDTTGAGDAFAAGFLACWLLHPEPESALAAGHRLAAVAVAAVGARP